MDLSIIIPVYNSETTINSCLVSIAKQKTQYSFEVIAVDDGSTDNSLDILKDLKKKYQWLHVIAQANSKQAEARNNGLQNSSGDFVTFIDADDLLSEKYIQQMIKPLKLTQQFKWSICGIRKCWPQREVIERESIFKNATLKSQIDLTGLFLNRNNEMDAGLWNKIYSTEIIRKNGLTFKNENFYEDTLFNLEYFLSISPDEIYTTTEVLYTLNRIGKSTTTTYDKNMDILSDNFFKIAEHLVMEHFSDQKRTSVIIDTLQVRLTIHKIHYHLVTDINWTSKDTKRIVKKNLFFSKLINEYDLSVKYKISCLMLIAFPKLYGKMYLEHR